MNGPINTGHERVALEDVGNIAFDSLRVPVHVKRTGFLARFTVAAPAPGVACPQKACRCGGDITAAQGNELQTFAFDEIRVIGMPVRHGFETGVGRGIIQFEEGVDQSLLTSDCFIAKFGIAFDVFSDAFGVDEFIVLAGDVFAGDGNIITAFEGFHQGGRAAAAHRHYTEFARHRLVIGDW
jgi:hypothetical protein